MSSFFAPKTAKCCVSNKSLGSFPLFSIFFDFRGNLPQSRRRQGGWKISSPGHFRWIDDKDKIMVESVWWVDGLVDESPPHFEDEVGEGWLVVASAEAVSAIEASPTFAVGGLLGP